MVDALTLLSLVLPSSVFLPWKPAKAAEVMKHVSVSKESSTGCLPLKVFRRFSGLLLALLALKTKLTSPDSKHLVNVTKNFMAQGTLNLN